MHLPSSAVLPSGLSSLHGMQKVLVTRGTSALPALLTALLHSLQHTNWLPGQGCSDFRERWLGQALPELRLETAG